MLVLKNKMNIARSFYSDQNEQVWSKPGCHDGTGAGQDAPVSSVNIAHNLHTPKETRLVVKGHLSKILFSCLEIKLWFLANNNIITTLL